MTTQQHDFNFNKKDVCINNIKSIRNPKICKVIVNFVVNTRPKIGMGFGIYKLILDDFQTSSVLPNKT